MLVYGVRDANIELIGRLFIGDRLLRRLESYKFALVFQGSADDAAKTHFAYRAVSGLSEAACARAVTESDARIGRR